MRTIMIVYAFMLGFASLGNVSAENNKVDICHFEEAKNSWKLISLPQLSAAGHLENHDDAIPGGTTAQTDTVLDAGCVEVEVTCPCEGKEVLGVVWDESFVTWQCFVLDDRVYLEEFCGRPELQDLLDDDCTSLFLRVRSLETRTCSIEIEREEHPWEVLVLTTSPAEHAACLESLRQIAANDGEDCIEF